jgi:hypothetical protein
LFLKKRKKKEKAKKMYFKMSTQARSWWTRRLEGLAWDQFSSNPKR